MIQELYQTIENLDKEKVFKKAQRHFFDGVNLNIVRNDIDSKIKNYSHFSNILN